MRKNIESNFSPEPEIEQKIFKIEDLFDPERSVSNEYKQIIKNGESKNVYLKTKYSEYWGDFLRNPDSAPNASDFFREHIQGSMLVDLGGGGYSTHKGSMMFDLAGIFDAKAYISVDKFAYGENSEYDKSAPVDRMGRKGNVRRDLRCFYIQSDMLEFVSKMKDNSVNFALNGIDSYVIGDEEYHTALAKEIARATRSDGIVFGVNSDISYLLNHNSEFLSELDGLGLQDTGVDTFAYTKQTKGENWEMEGEFGEVEPEKDPEPDMEFINKLIQEAEEEKRNNKK
ncbi:MAG: hypothetical protein HQ539_03350 [Parcubacteria group bacterium]|nr:hypothetical protein [Parcubacteria group bacterium]